jgi:glycosyltransferase involved in cell wall biosynthesis
MFVTPAASSAGGNVFMLNFLRWFKRNSSIPFFTVFGYGGDLEREFAALSETFIHGYDWKNLSFAGKSLQKIRQTLKLKEKRLKAEIERKNIGLIYSNTVINHEVLATFSDLNAPLISHCHELESVIYRTGIEGFNETKRKTEHFIAVSEAVRRNLIANHAVAAEKISTIHGFVPLEEISETAIGEKRKRILRELDLPENAFIVGASGTMYWRKAPEIFIQIADRVKKQKPDAPVYFLWIGGANKGDFVFFEMNYDVEKLGLEKTIRFLEHKKNPLDYFAAIDVFALVSREDPFPLVCLEAASLGKPVICFENAGGMPEFVETDCGFVVPYLNIEKFAERILELCADPELKNQMGNAAKQKVWRNHNIEISAPKILEIIERFREK